VIIITEETYRFQINEASDSYKPHNFFQSHEEFERKGNSTWEGNGIRATLSKRGNDEYVEVEAYESPEIQNSEFSDSVDEIVNDIIPRITEAGVAVDNPEYGETKADWRHPDKRKEVRESLYEDFIEERYSEFVSTEDTHAELVADGGGNSNSMAGMGAVESGPTGSGGEGVDEMYNLPG
jgi:hypothetical protein